MLWLGERDIVGDLRRRLLGAGSSANSAVVAAASSDGEDFPATPRIRIANNGINRYVHIKLSLLTVFLLDSTVINVYECPKFWGERSWKF